MGLSTLSQLQEISSSSRTGGISNIVIIIMII